MTINSDASNSTTIINSAPVAPQSDYMINFSVKNLKSLFFCWFAKDLFIKVNESFTTDEKSVVKKMSKMVIYMRYFIPLNYNELLQSKPTESIELKKWSEELLLCAAEVQVHFMNFLNIYNPTMKPSAKIKASIWTAEKIADRIPMRDYPQLRNSDKITTPSHHVWTGSVPRATTE